MTTITAGRHLVILVLASLTTAFLYVRNFKQPRSLNEDIQWLQPKPRIRSNAKFLFIMGLEGTGHHFMHDLILASPHLKRLESLGLHPNMTEKLILALYHNEDESLFTAWQHQSKFERQGNSHRVKGTPIDQTVIDNHMVQLSQLQDQVVQTLLEIKKALPTSEQITIPVNTLVENAGMMSYPNFAGRYRYLQHPNLDLFYDACDTAQVECSHVYLYRDPYSILKSTSSPDRKFNKNQLEATHLYQTDLAVMSGQLMDHPQRTVGCFGFYEPNVMQDQDLWKPLQQLLGWTNPQAFQDYLRDAYVAPEKITQQEKEELVPPEWKPAMKSWLRSHHRTMDLCQRNLATYKGSTSKTWR